MFKMVYFLRQSCQYHFFSFRDSLSHLMVSKTLHYKDSNSTVVIFSAIPIYLRWITYLSYIRYGFEATALATYGFEREKLKCLQTYCHFKSPSTTLVNI